MSTYSGFSSRLSRGQNFLQEKMIPALNGFWNIFTRTVCILCLNRFWSYRNGKIAKVCAFHTSIALCDSVHLLFTENVLALTREQTNRYVYLCDLLYNIILQHHFRSNFYVLSSNNILSRIATLLRAKDKHLRHGASISDSRDTSPFSTAKH